MLRPNFGDFKISSSNQLNGYDASIPTNIYKAAPNVCDLYSLIFRKN